MSCSTNSWDIHSTDNSQMFTTMPFATNGRCKNCDIVWNNANISEDNLPHMSKFISKAKELQRNLCYTSRSYQSMSAQTILSYTRMSSVFELNWTFIYPLSSCATEMYTDMYTKNVSMIDNTLENNIEYKLKEDSSWSRLFSSYSTNFSASLNLSDANSNYCLLPAYTSYLIPPFQLKSFHFSVVNYYYQNEDSTMSQSFSEDSTYLANESTILSLLTSREVFCDPIKHLFNTDTNIGLLPVVRNDSNVEVHLIPDDYLFNSFQKDKNNYYLTKFIKTQSSKLDICGVYPPNLLPIYLHIPQNVKSLLQLPVHLRFATLRRSKSLNLDRSKFCRVIKSNTMKNPLYVESAPLSELHFSSTESHKYRKATSKLKEKSERYELDDDEFSDNQILINIESPTIQPQKFVLLVCFSGKDMIGLDWLPFISRYLNYYILKENYNSNVPRAKTKALQRLEPLIQIPEALLSFLDKNTSKYKHLGPSNSTISSFDVEYTKNSELYNIKTAILLVDYPGYGKSIGKPNTLSITDSAIQSLRSAILALSKTYPSALSHLDIHFLGYSLGAAVALHVACSIIKDLCIVEKQKTTYTSAHLGPLLQYGDFEYPIKNIKLNKLILIAPFTSVSEWAVTYLGVPYGFQPILKSLIQSFTESDVNWDNLKALKYLYSLLNEHPTLWNTFELHIFHGKNDNVVPFWMSERIANEAFRLRYFSNKTGSQGKFKRCDQKINIESNGKSSPLHWNHVQQTSYYLHEFVSNHNQTFDLKSNLLVHVRIVDLIMFY